MKFSVQDQEKMGMEIHQKNVRQQEQERQWKQLQAMRAREQQIQQIQTMPEKIHGKNFKKSTLSNSNFDHSNIPIIRID